jgi:hypothetical protein
MKTKAGAISSGCAARPIAVPAPKLCHLLGRPVGRIERGPDRARRDGVDADAAVDQLRRERFREGVNSALGHRIVEQRLAPFYRRR